MVLGMTGISRNLWGCMCVYMYIYIYTYRHIEGVIGYRFYRYIQLSICNHPSSSGYSGITHEAGVILRLQVNSKPSIT